MARPSDFTYTSIEQPVIQVYNPFSQFLGLFSNASNLKREKMIQNGSITFTGYIWAPNGLRGSYTLFYKSTTSFYRTIPHFTQFLGQFLFPNAANSKREKQLQNGTKRVDLPPQGI